MLTWQYLVEISVTSDASIEVKGSRAIKLKQALAHTHSLPLSLAAIKTSAYGTEQTAVNTSDAAAAGSKRKRND